MRVWSVPGAGEASDEAEEVISIIGRIKFYQKAGVRSESKFYLSAGQDAGMKRRG